MRTNLFGEPLNVKGHILGCSACPLDKVPGVNKVKGLIRIQARRAMLWAQSPGGRENEKKIELVGPSGKLTWDAFEYHGLTRNMFDVQNVMRCQPLAPDGRDYDIADKKFKQALSCCSVYNDEALTLNKGQAHVHVIFGDVAGGQLLGKAFKKDRPIIWYAPWDAYVILAHHPSYLLHKGGDKAGWEYIAWRDRIGAVKTILKYPGRFGYLKSRNYKAVKTIKQFDEMERIILSEAKAGRRVSMDIEDDIIDGKRVVLLVGFGIGHFRISKKFDTWQAQSWSVVLNHPESGHTPRQLKELEDRTKALVEDPSVKKSLQNGTYDLKSCKESLGVKIGGYDYDTRYGTYLRYSFLRSFSLENLTYLFFPEFGDYKTIVEPWDSTGFAKAPLDLLVLRNCGDCEVTQKLEQRFSPEINQPLVKVYIHAGKTLDIMTKERGPILDWENWNKAIEVVPKMIAKLERMLKRLANDQNFNIDNPLHVAHLIYDVLKIPMDEETGRSTNKLVLEKLLAETGNLSLDLVMKARTLKKIKSTYLDPYAFSAKLNNDELRTIWHLSGAATGRLRSGKGDDGNAKGIINFQNLHSTPLLQNLLISDKNWRRLLTENL